MISNGILWLIVVGALTPAVVAQSPPGSISQGPGMEMVTGDIRPVEGTDGRTSVLRLLMRARSNYLLRAAGRAYDVKTTFMVDSGGQTAYDGSWQMEDVFDLKQGLRWDAKASSGYSATRISVNGMLYGDDGGSYIPLRLHEARAALFDPIPPRKTLEQTSIRTSTATLNGVGLTCALLSGPRARSADSMTRRWDETEECIDSQTGLLMTHSQAPGRYYIYDYSNAQPVAGHMLPRKVVITEAGKTVSTISVESVTAVDAADPGLFSITDAMKAEGRPVGLGGAQKVSRFLGGTAPPAGTPTRTVCVFGVVTPSGELAEAHSLQPSDPNSQAAVEDAKRMTFSRPPGVGAEHQQYFVFVIERFAASQ